MCDQTLQWKPSDRPACEELLQEAWMQARGGSRDSAEAGAADSAYRPQAAADSAEAAAVAPSQGKTTPCISPGLSVIAASSQGQGSQWRFGAQVTCTTWQSSKPCQCAGHCYVPGHRYQGGCDAVTLLSGSTYCPSCTCTVHACTRPRLRGDLCSAHKAVWEHGSLELVLTRCARKALPWWIPCDITDFINLYPSVRHDKAFVVIIALLKEPFATACFVEKALALAPEYGVDDLAAVLLEMLDDMRSPTTEAHR